MMTREHGDGGGPLVGQCFQLVGRMHGITRRRLEQLVRVGGGRLATKPSARVNAVALGHTAVSAVLPDGRLALPPGLPAAASLISENEFRRRLGVLRPPQAVERTLGSAELLRLSGLTPAHLACLRLFDVVEPVDERFSYRDLVAAREAGRLLAHGVALRRILEAAAALRRRGADLADTKLAQGPSGELVRDIHGQLAELSGQLVLRLDQDARGVDDLVAAAEGAEERHDLAAAERLYTTAMRADTDDPVLPFNLGNVLGALARPVEARIAWQIAIARDPSFAEAWYNLAMAAEDEEQWDLAVAQYRRAVQARPDYADAHFNLALLLTRLERCGEAVPLWDRFLELDPTSRHAGTARRAAALCRMQLKKQKA